MGKKDSIEKLNELLKGEKMAANIYEDTKSLQEDSQVEEMLEEFPKIIIVMLRS